MMRISQLAERTGVPATTLRFYETEGLLPAKRTAAGYRAYDERAVDRLAFIGAAKHLGLPLEEIADLLPLWESGGCGQVKAGLRPRITAGIARAERRAEELAAFISTARGALEGLEALPDDEGPCGPRCASLADGERWRSAPVACSLTGAEVAERAGQWEAALSGACHEQTFDGVRLVVPAERAARIAELAASEQRCCPFFDFRLHLDGPVLRIEVRAPAEAAALLAELFVSPA
ncbi:DNA-binding transcriptional regulator, MerR family [Prauserella marina]|uniref:DNA-binding transcriptional regulator, MerR family n=2 Tax=Prauserella marina TaxID=530584 RepID=A0A1G6LGK4_9PSEU|nr:DNA-binding transcriptional MerR regulator [Prauserella marina]SDC42562.1 DNA-binding transcriptional regulator, MerR family [Prauserella marina]